MTIKPVSSHNMAALTSLSLELWPEGDFQEEYAHFRDLHASSDATCFVVKVEEQYVGFIYLTLRKDYVEGSDSSPVAYVEGIYIRPAYRGQGIGKRLIKRGEDWGKQFGCTQLGSDVEWPNEDSLSFHQAVGFQEVNRVVCFIKDIP